MPSRTPHASSSSRGGGPIFISGEALGVEQYPDLRLDRLAGVHCGLLPFRFHAVCHVPFSTTCFPRIFHLIGRKSPSPRPRSRSPPFNGRDDRRHSPPRYQEYLSDTSRHPYRGRAESPPQRFRDPNKLDRRDIQPDLPQRRPRGISDVHDPDYAPKRRKVDGDDRNLPPVRRNPVGVGVDTYIPLETSTASTSPRSTGALDDLSRMSSLSNKRFVFTLVSFVRIRDFQDSAEENPCLHKAIVTEKHLI